MYEGDLPEVEVIEVKKSNVDYKLVITIPMSILDATPLAGEDLTLTAMVGFCPRQPEQKMMSVVPIRVDELEIMPTKNPYRYSMTEGQTEYPLDGMKADFASEARQMLGKLLDLQSFINAMEES